jgi:hypothetical protein
MWHGFLFRINKVLDVCFSAETENPEKFFLQFFSRFWPNLVTINDKQPLCRPGQALRVPRDLGSQISRHMNVVRLSALRASRFYHPPPPKKIFLVLIAVRG